jgi:hypothetical protein
MAKGPAYGICTFTRMHPGLSALFSSHGVQVLVFTVMPLAM